MPELKKKKSKSSTTAPVTPIDWELEGESSGHARNPSPAPSHTRSISHKQAHSSRPTSQMAEPAAGRHSEGGVEFEEPVGRISTDNGRPDFLEPAAQDAAHGHDHIPISKASSTTSSVRGRVTSASDKKSRRPPGSRRNSTHPNTISKPRPEFSVDDNESEIEEDLNTQRIRGTIQGSTSYSQMRRHSLLRRRTTTGGAGEDEHAEHSEAGEIDDEAEIEGEEGEGTGSYAPSEADSVESFTLKDRQQAINETHPFGIRIWKPALYKKNRSVQRTAEGDIHSQPGARIGPLLMIVNILWVVVFGWWLALASLIAGVSCSLFLTASAREYGRVFFGLSWYLFYPFGNFVEFEQEEAYLEEDEGEGRSISEYERWQAGDLEGGGTFFEPRTPRSIIGRRRASMDSSGETESLLGAGYRRGYSTLEDSPTRGAHKRRLFGRGDWNIGRIVFFTWFYFVIAPLLLLVSLICWWLVFTIPMAKVTSHLCSHLRRHPLALSFHSTASHRSHSNGTRNPSILLCTYRAVGWKYYKYTIDGTNIFFINLMSVVVFVIVDHYVLAEGMGLKNMFTEPATIFTLALSSVIPLAYFIGQAVASISAQSSMGMGATINAFFSTVVEVYLYIIALDEGKGRLVEGSIVGSILAGILFMPGISMCSGAFVRKTQRFNARSAGVTSTMLLFAIIGAFAPTLFYQIYGTYELNCGKCHGSKNTDCQKCVFTQVPAATDKFYYDAVLPFTYFSAIFLFISYCIGLWFTLRTHAASIWQSPGAEAIPQQLQSAFLLGSLGQRRDGQAPAFQSESIRQGYTKDPQLYKRILGQSLTGVGMRPDGAVPSLATASTAHPGQSLHVVPPKSSAGESSAPAGPTPAIPSLPETVAIPGLSSEQNARLVRGVVEVAAAAATAAVHDAQRQQEQQSSAARKLNAVAAEQIPSIPNTHPHATLATDTATAGEELGAHGGHDAPNWGKAKSAIILLGATILYAIIAEILVKTVDVVLDNIEIDEKFLGITLFALVPNTTEFLNAISFAMNGNIALSMEIGSAYALQVCLLQIPALVAWSAYSMGTWSKDQILTHTFTLIFPQWDLVTVILCVFLLSYMYGEGKSNYFKGSILILSYFTVMMGFYFSSYADVPMNSKINAWGKAGSGSRAGGYIIDL